MRLRTSCFRLQFPVFVGVLVGLVSMCYGQQYPTRAIDMVLPHTPGGGVDFVFRGIREPLEKELKVPLTITNRPGGGSSVGSAFVAKCKPDGYTIMGQEIVTHVIGAIMNPSLPYDPMKDFEMIAHIAVGPSLLAVRAESELKTIEDLISYAKKNPGRIVVATAGVGSTPHFLVELLKSAAGINLTHLPLGGGEVITNLLGGHVDCSIVTLPAVKSLIKAGKLRVLVTMSPERIHSLPDIPTTKEKGLPEVDLNTQLGILGPKGLSPEVIAKWVSAVDSTFKNPDVIKWFNDMDYTLGFLRRDQLREYMEETFKRLTDVARKAGFSKI